jgi:hypothetical protein
MKAMEEMNESNRQKRTSASLHLLTDQINDFPSVSLDVELTNWTYN